MDHNRVSLGEFASFPHLFYVENIKISVYVKSLLNFNIFSESASVHDIDAAIMEYNTTSYSKLTLTHVLGCLSKSYLKG